MLELHKRLLHLLHLGIGVAHDAPGFQLRVAEDQLGLLASVGLGLIGLELSRDQCLLQRIPQLQMRGELFLKPADPLLQLGVLLVEPLELVGYLVEKEVHLLVRVPAYRAFELLPADIERGDLHFALPSHREHGREPLLLTDTTIQSRWTRLRFAAYALPRPFVGPRGYRRRGLPRPRGWQERRSWYRPARPPGP